MEGGTEHEQPGHGIAVAGIAALQRLRMQRQDARVVRMRGRQTFRVWLAERSVSERCVHAGDDTGGWSGR